MKRQSRRSGRPPVIAGTVLALCAVILLLVLFLRPGRLSNGQLEGLDTSMPLVRSAMGDGVYYTCVNRSGLFYLDGTRMCYCDYASGQTYVLCNDPSCLHADSSCGASLGVYASFAVQDGSAYAVYQEDGAFQLVAMDLNGKNRRTLATFPVDYQEGSWALEKMNYQDIYYGYGKAFLTLNYTMVDPPETRYQGAYTRYELVMIDLSDGTQTLLARSEGTSIYHSLAFKAISEDYVVIYQTEVPGALYGEALEEAMADGLEGTLTELLNEIPEEERFSYWADRLDIFYSDHAVTQLCQRYDTLIVYDMRTGTSSTLWSGEATPNYTHGSAQYGWSTPYSCLGWLDGDLILRTTSYDEDTFERNSTIVRWPLDEQTPTLLLDMGTGANPMMSFGAVGNLVLDDGKLIWLDYLEDGETAQFYCFDLRTGSNTPLFIDDRYVTFRFLGEIDDYFIGDMIVGEDHSAYILSKADYYQGNWSAARKLLSDE